jgi:regulatory protein
VSEPDPPTDHATDHATDHETDPATDHEAVARAVALRLLTRGPRSRAQLAEAMARKDVPDDVARAVLDRFTAVGLVDDAEYARMLVRARQEDRGLARRALVVELRSKGIDDEVAADALGGLDAEQEETTARELARRRLAGSRGLAREVRLRRVVAMLGRKGYSSGLAVKIGCELLAAEGESGPDPSADPFEGLDVQARGYVGDD